MNENEEVLWEGEVSTRYKDKENIAKVLVFGLLIALEMLIIIVYSIFFDRIPRSWGHIGFFLLLSIILVGMILTIYALNSTGWKDQFPKFYVTAEKLILKDWNFWRKLKIQTFELAKINTIYVVDDSFPEKDSFWFYRKTAAEILGDCTQDVLNFGEEYNVTPYDCFFGFDFEFEAVNSPIHLLKALESLITLQQHPKYKYLFVRVE